MPLEHIHLLNEAAALLLAADTGDCEVLLRARDLALLAAQHTPRQRDEITRALTLIEAVRSSACEAPAEALLEAASILEALCEEVDNPPCVGPTVRGPSREAPAPPVLEVSAPPQKSRFPATESSNLALDSLAPQFVSEALEHLARAEAALLPLEANPTAAEHLDTLFRAFHTLKSTSGFLGFGPIHDLAYQAEELLDRARRREVVVSGDTADLVLESCDLLREMVRAIGSPGSARAKPRQYEEVLRRLGSVQSTPDPTPGCPQDKPHEASGALCWTAPDGSARVSTERLDTIVNLVGELVIAHSITAQDPDIRSGRLTRLAQNVAQTEKILHGLQELAMSLRLVPLRATFQTMARLVRDLSRKSGRQVKFACEGEDTEIDRRMVQELGDPLLHMIRNAVDHGIEPAEERQARGKPEEATITLRAYHSAGQVVVEVADDGRGLDRQAILEEGLRRGFVDPESQPGDEALFNLLLLPGFSTAKTVTDLSGRGVGMDVVRQRLQALRGRLEVESQPGCGTTFRLHLPLTTAIMDAMLVRVGTRRFLLPVESIVQSFCAAPERVVTLPGRGEVTLLRGETLRVVRLARVFGIAAPAGDAVSGILVVVEADRGRYALLVDDLLGQNRVVVKPLDPGFAQHPGISGAAILGDGRVGLILDAGGLAMLANARPSSGQSGPEDRNPGRAPPAAAARKHQGASALVGDPRSAVPD